VFQRDKNEENGPNVREAARPIPLRAGAGDSAFSREKEHKKKPETCVVLVVKDKA
jgi:hypothetical protein